MVRRVYSVFDVVSDEFVGPLMLYPTNAAAIRVFTEALTASDSLLSKHPGDYDLYLLGELNTVTGELSAQYEEVLAGADWVANLIPREVPNGS